MDARDGSQQQVRTAQADAADVFIRSGKTVLALLESASQAIISVSRSGRIALANRRAEEMFGYSREELLGARLARKLRQVLGEM